MGTEDGKLKEFKLKPMNCELNFLSKSDGSAILSQGTTVALTSVNGPLEVKLSSQSIEKTTLEVLFSCKGGKPSVKDRYKENVIRQTCEEAILSSLYPRTGVTVTVQELEDYGGLLSTCVNCACLALINSGVAMRHVFAAVQCCVDGRGDVVLEPAAGQLDDARAVLSFVFDERDKSLVTGFTEGSYSEDTYKEAMERCRAASDLVFAFYRDIDWNSLPASVFPDHYNLGVFKARVNRLFLDGHDISSAASSHQGYNLPRLTLLLSRRGYSNHEVLDWREALAKAERTVGFPTSFLNLRWLFNDEIAGTAIHLRKLVGTNHPLLRSAKNLLIGSKSNLQSVGLVILLVSKSAGINTREFTEDQYNSGILHSQRALAEIVEMKRTGHMIHKTMVNLQEKEKLGDKFQDLLCGNKLVLLSGDYLLAKCLQHLGGLHNNAVTELISSGLRDLVEGDFLGEHGPDNTPVPTKPKAENVVEPYDWENEYNLEKLGSNDYLGQGKEEWVLRTMLQSGSILAKGCQGAMKLARRGEEMERDAYILGGHLALLWQLYLDIKDFFIHPQSYSLVGAPVIMALWEYPSIYGQLWIPKMERRPVELQQLHYVVRSTRSLDYLTGLLDEELAAILKYSDRFPVDDARDALQQMARTIHGEALQYIEN